MSAPGPGAVDAGEVGAVPSGASLEVVDSSFGLRGQQQRDQAQAAVPRITGELADIAEAAMREAAAVVRNARRALRTTTGGRSLDAMERARRPAERRRVTRVDTLRHRPIRPPKRRLWPPLRPALDRFAATTET
jgi:hypothetical protein